ncbi:hypothetical protein RDABS01_005736 [Bienertia sinuspersici]
MIDEDSNSLSDSLRFEAQALITELKKLEKCLVEAEANSQGSNNNEQVRARFAKVRRMVYDAEDVVDRFVSETESSAYGRLTYLPRSIRDSKKLHKSRDQIAGMMDTMYNESLRYGGHDHITENNGSPKTGNQLVVKQANHHLDDEFVVALKLILSETRAYNYGPKSARERKVLVVFDGVWDWELEMVHKLLDIPDSGVLKSKLVITSRQFFPSPNTGWIFHETKLLSNDDSLTLFNKVSSSSNGREFGRKYPGSTKEILTKCGGLPLAIVVIGRLLEKRNTINEWEKEGFVKSQQREGETPEKAATRLLHELVNHAMVQPVTLQLYS